jgi:hypothetical protein
MALTDVLGSAHGNLRLRTSAMLNQQRGSHAARRTRSGLAPERVLLFAHSERIDQGPETMGGACPATFPDERQQFRCGARLRMLVIGPGQRVGRPVESRRSQRDERTAERLP